MLSLNDLAILQQLASRASIPVSDVPQVWPVIQRLEQEMRDRRSARDARDESPGGSD